MIDSVRSQLATAGTLALLLAGCSDPSDDEPGEPPPSAGPASSPSPTETGTDDAAIDEPAPEEEETLPAVTHRLSLPAIMRREPYGSRPVVTLTELTNQAYTRQQVTYTSDGATVSGVLLRPAGTGPFPGIVLNHGYIEPSIYDPGQGMAREQDALARAGFVVLHTDYRGHAGSDAVRPFERESRLAYTRDAINAVASLEKLPYVDGDRLAMMGRSMGGGVTMNALVTQPGLVDAAVIYASVSSAFLDNLDHFTVPNRPETARALYDRFGTPEQSPDFYAGLSARTYFDRITEPVLSLHGAADATCPPRWARQTQNLMQQAGVDSRLTFYPGEDHAFYARWQDSMDLSIRFIREQFRQG